MNPSNTELMQAFVVSHGDARFESGLAEGSTNGLMVGLLIGALFLGGLVLLGASRSSVDASYSFHAGAVAQVPQTRSTVTPVVGQAVTDDSSSTGPAWKS
jgi:hypothetical protein